MDPTTLAALLGTGTGTIGGGLSSYYQNQALNKYISGLSNMQTQANQMSADEIARINAAYDPLTRGYTQSYNDYLTNLANTDLTQYEVTAPEDFQYDLAAETQALLNPELNAIINRANQGVLASSANAGDLFSGAAGKAVARSTADITAQEYKTAQQAALTQQANKYQQYQDKFTNALKVAETNKNNLLGNLNLQGTGLNLQSQNFNTQQSALNNAYNTQNQNLMSILNAQNTAQAQQAGTPSVLGGVLQGALGGLGSALGG